MALSLTDVFPDFTARWPTALVRWFVGEPPAGAPDPHAWIAAMIRGVSLANVRPGALAGAVALSADLGFDNARAAYTAVAPEGGDSDGFPVVLAAMPDVLFRVHTLSRRTATLFVAATDRGTSVVIEGLPVDIVLPSGFIDPPADTAGSLGGIGSTTVGDFTAGQLDALRIVYRRRGATTISVHVRVTLSERGELSVRTAVPVNFGRCRFLDVPVRAIYDFALLPSPAAAFGEQVEWLRHGVAPFLTAGPQGSFSFRGLDLDPDEEPLRSLGRDLNRRRTRRPEDDYTVGRDGEPPRAPAGSPFPDHPAEFVLEDLVFPFFAPYFLPIPRHATLGLRRHIVDATDVQNLFDFTRAPVRFQFGAEPSWGFYIERLFFESQPIAGDLPPGEAVLAFLSQFNVALGLFYGADGARQDGFEFELGEDVTPRLAFRRALGPDGLPPRTGAGGVLDRLTHYELVGMNIDLMAIRIGYALGNMLRSGHDYSSTPGFALADFGELLVDLFVSAPVRPSNVLRLRSFTGQRAAFALENIGWKQGAIHFEGVSSPPGVVIGIGPESIGLDLLLREISVIAENSGNYFCFSGGLGFTVPSGCQGGAELRRMRIKLAGPPSAPPFLMDGIFVRIRKLPTFALEIGGYYSEQALPPTAPTIRRSEFGLTGNLTVKTGDTAWGASLDFLLGQIEALVTPAPPNSNFWYGLFALSLRGSLVLGCVELRGLQALCAINMQPALGNVDRSKGELRYYEWYRTRENPIEVPGDRRLSAWAPQHDTVSLGIGVQASFPGCGRAIEFALFLMAVVGSDENGLLVAFEVRLFSNPKPVGWGVIEWDARRGTFSFLAGVDVGIDQFVKDPPDWVRRLIRLTGTLFIGNQPGCFALGRLRDMDSWLSLRFDINAWFRALFQVGICVEYNDAPDGATGFGLVARFDGGWDVFVLAITWNLGLGATVAGFRTGSVDVTARVWIEGGLHVTVFGFLNFGISAGIELRYIGNRPARADLHCELRIETPWFLPDIDFVVDVGFGTIAPAELGSAVQPLQRASAREDTTDRSLDAHCERVDGGGEAPWDGLGTAPLHSVVELRTMGAPEADRQRRFDDSALPPIATDATIAIELSIEVNDHLGIAGLSSTEPVVQRNGDLTLTYDLVGMTVRRRPRFGGDRAWRSVEERMALPADFSDPDGVTLSGGFGPQVLSKVWDPSVQVMERPVAKKLLLNCQTPFDFVDAAPTVDERLVRDNPAWPCCPPDLPERPLPVHQVAFDGEARGRGVGSRRFTDSESVLRPISRAVVRAPRVPGPERHVRTAVFGGRGHGVLWRAAFDEDVAFCVVHAAWTASPDHRLVLLALDAAGAPVGETVQSLGGPGAAALRVGATAAIRSAELRLIGPSADVGPPPEPGRTKAAKGGNTGQPGQPGQSDAPEIEVDAIEYVGLRDFLQRLRDEAACADADERRRASLEGRGKLFLLPNTEYELAFTTRITIAHPSQPPESTEVTEWAYVRTKGLPGLNACARVGEELAPHVDRAYTGGRGALYREEPVTLAFKDELNIAVPVTHRSTPAGPETAELFEMQLVVRPDVAVDPGTVVTTTSDDWIERHRRSAPPFLTGAWRPELSTSDTAIVRQRSVDPQRLRLAALTQRPEVDCDLADPRDVSTAVLIARPQGEPAWRPASGYTATVRRRGAPFIDRTPLVAEDATAFDVHGGALEGSDGGVRAVGPLVALFGESDWNHLVVETAIAIAGGGAGLGVGVRDGGATGWFALIDGDQLALQIREGGVPRTVASQPLPPSTDPWLLRLTAFDDVVRAAVGEVVVEAPRGELGDGPCALLATGTATFSMLRVTGLALYEVPFRTSRYLSFAEHLGSFDGTVPAIAPDALGAGTTTATVTDAWRSRADRIAEVMRPDAEASARQAVFDELVHAIGLPLRDEVKKVELSRYGSPAAQLLFLESPEPLDFTEEIAVGLVRRVVHVAPRDPSILRDALVERTIPAGGFGELLPFVHGAVKVDDSLFVPLGQPTPHIAERVADGVRLYKPGRTIGDHLETVLSDHVVAGSGSTLLSPQLLGLQPGELAILSPDLRDVIGRLPPLAAPGRGDTWEDVAVQVIQDGSGRRALLVPVAGPIGSAGGAAPITLAPGLYRLRLALDRARFTTTAPPDDVNRYRREVTWTLSL